MLITFTIPAEHVDRLIDAIHAKFPIGPEDEDAGFTRPQWAKEAVRRYLVHLVRRHEGGIADTAARRDVPSGLVT